jgi:hypothetical protein
LAFRLGDLSFNNQIGNTITDIPYNSSYSSNAYVGDVLVGKNYIYIVHLNMNYVSQYAKNSDGTIGARLRTNSWRAYDTTIDQISTSSVPGAYTLYVENGQDYLVGWSRNYTTIYTWKINSNNTISNRSSYNAPVSITNYSRGGWDGGNYIYFVDQGRNRLYRWNLNSKGTQPAHILNFPNGVYSLNSSFTGSGLYILNGKLYWGTGSNQQDGMLGAFDMSTGLFIDRVYPNQLPSIGVSQITGNYGNVTISPLHPNIGYYFYAHSNQIKQISVNSLLNIKEVSITPEVHTEKAILKASILNIMPNEQPKFSFKVFVGDKQVFPSSGWSSQFQTPYNLSVSIDHEHLSVGSNTVKLQVQDEQGGNQFSTVTVTKVNRTPIINASFSSMIVHKESVVVDATITDPELDFVQYRVLVNDKQLYPNTGYTPLVESPSDIRVIIPNEILKLGVNTVKFVLRDALGGTVNSSNYNVIKQNKTPKVTIGKVEGGLLIATITDDDKDRVKYRVLLNNNQVFPQIDYTDYLNIPFDVKVRFPQDMILIGETNRVKIEFKDDMMDAPISWETTFIGDYSGLMFCDASESYYSNHIGEILKYLDFGTIVAGQTTIAERVFVKNTLGYPVENLVLRVNQRDIALQGSHARVEISQYDAPFISESELIFPNGLKDKERLSFYIQIVTDREAKAGGMFDVTVTADPLKPLFDDKRDMSSKIIVNVNE